MAKQTGKPKQIIRLILSMILGSAFALPMHSQSSAATSIPSEAKKQAAGKNAQPLSGASALDARAQASPHATAEEIRQGQIVEDTKELYFLSAELRAEVAKTYKESLSLTVLKKAEEVEKLARNLKELMNQEAAAARK